MINIGVLVPPRLQRTVQRRHHNINRCDLRAHHLRQRCANKADLRTMHPPIDALTEPPSHQCIRTARRMEEAGQELHHGRLTRTVRPDHHPPFAT